MTTQWEGASQLKVGSVTTRKASVSMQLIALTSKIQTSLMYHSNTVPVQAQDQLLVVVESLSLEKAYSFKEMSKLRAFLMFRSLLTIQYWVRSLNSHSLVGGSGGSIFLSIIDQISFYKVIVGVIRADGGKGTSSGGSGGRIIFDIFSGNYSSTNMVGAQKQTVSAQGGGNESSSLCNFGGSGTIFFRNESKLLIIGPSLFG